MSDNVLDIKETSEVPAISLDIDVTTLSSAALARLVEEVRNDEGTSARSYDRVHNRHNR